MSIRVRISYERPQELHTILKLLRPIVKSYKADKGEKGQYKRAYLEVDIPEEKGQESVN